MIDLTARSLNRWLEGDMHVAALEHVTDKIDFNLVFDKNKQDRTSYTSRAYTECPDG